MREVIDLLTSHPPSLTTLTDIIPHNLTLSPSSPLALQLLCLQSIIEDMSHPPPPDHTPPPPDHTHPPPGHTHSPPGHTPPPLLEQVATATSQPHGQSHDDDDVVLQSRPARDHRRSNSWSGVPQHLLVGRGGVVRGVVTSSYSPQSQKTYSNLMTKRRCGLYQVATPPPTHHYLGRNLKIRSPWKHPLWSPPQSTPE